ncbi:MAG: hypothetical protein A2X32_00425 [Elusimicrobia bacterium GWC2_64_44]|nr:MAG: hypothetical protein A2X32_00425 [Elusimicrobia bacterium GWC2_64_44]
MRFLSFKAVVLCALAAAAACVPCVPAAAQPAQALPAFAAAAGTPLLSQAAATGTVVGQGGNYAVPLADGRTLWLLNNIWAGELRPGGQAAVWGIVDGGAALVSSTSPYAQAGDLAYVSDENRWPLPLLSGDLKEYSQVRKFWPRSFFCGAGKCQVFYSIMNNYGPEPYDYFRVGQGVATAADPGGPYEKARRDGRYSLWNDIEPAFGSALLPDEDGWVYVYGRVMNAPGEYAARLARVKPDGLADREKYDYYSLSESTVAWTSDISEAADVLPGMPEEFSVSYNDHLKAYLAVYSDPEGGRALARLARYPWGPWGEPAQLLPCAKEDYCYGAKEQPGFAAEGGKKIFVTLEKKNSPYLYEIIFE